MPTEIDINCDMGESYGNYRMGNDEAIFPWISSCNIACGFHGGDALQIEETIKKAMSHGLQLGAHPSYPDLQGFGRRYMQINPRELTAMLKYQISAVRGMTESLGGTLSYVKPHGALYNQAADHETEASAIVQAMKELRGDLKLMGLAGSMTEQIADAEGVPFITEAFADRKYNDQSRLLSRRQPHAVIHDPIQAAQQFISIVQHQFVISNEGKKVPVSAQSICIHGDNHAVIEILKAIDEALVKHQILKKAFA